MRNWYWLWMAAICFVGCEAKPEVIPVFPVSGQVLYAGAPAAGVRVYLLPTSAPMVPQVPTNPYAVTDQSGNFRMTTYTQGDGAAEGGYQIVMLWPDENQAETETGSTDKLLGWYDGANTQLTLVVKTGDNLIPPIQIPVISGPPAERQGVPGRN
nr:hypothetical protein [Pirellula staleyi]